MDYDETAAVNHLIEVLKDGELGFTAAAEDAADPDLKASLLRYANQRSDYTETLQLIVEESGETAEYAGTLGAILHQGWINLKGAIATRDDLAILEECEHAEDIAMGAYQFALAGDHLELTRPVIENQSAHIRAAHNHIRILRDALR
ncbi:MAG: PA2169 family four-helix-bundle protein [Acidobacteria bacterium]|nr:PA2169 family four-helix-bundle protein [Acidobacteriota bacterium]